MDNIPNFPTLDVDNTPSSLTLDLDNIPNFQTLDVDNTPSSLTGHSMSSQPPDGRHVTDFAEILQTIWDMKKKSRNPKMSVLRPPRPEIWLRKVSAISRF